MRKLIALGLIIALYSASAFAQAASQTLLYSWTVPTTRTDGSPLPVAQLSGYELTYAVEGSAPIVVPITGGATASASVTLNLAARAAPYALVSTLKAIDTIGQKSLPVSVTTNITVSPANPGIPANFKLTVTCVAGTCSLVVN